MLTRREILIELKSAGIKELSLLKWHCRDFEDYMAANYGFEYGQNQKEEGTFLYTDRKPSRLIEG